MRIVIPASTVESIERVANMLQRKSLREDEAGTRRKALAGDASAIRIVRKWDREDGKKSFPLYLPDGRDIETVAQVAAMLGTSEKVAARYVLEQKGLPEAMYEEATRLLPPPADDRNGIAIMLQADEETNIWLTGAADMALLDNDPESLHITLGYFGEISKDSPTLLELSELCRKIASNFDPFEVRLNGLTRFMSGGDRDPVVVNADSPVLEDMRQFVRHHPALNRDHGYTPHMTLGYLPADAEMPFTKFPSHDSGEEMPPITITRILLGYGDTYVTIPLNRRAEDRD